MGYGFGRMGAQMGALSRAQPVPPPLIQPPPQQQGALAPALPPPMMMPPQQGGDYQATIDMLAPRLASNSLSPRGEAWLNADRTHLGALQAPPQQQGGPPMAPSAGALSVAPPPGDGGGGPPPPAPVSLPGIAPPPNPNPASSALIAAAPQRAGYSPAIMAALGRNQPGLHLGTSAPGAPPVQPTPYNAPTPLNVIKSPDPAPPPTAGMLAAKEAAKNGDPSGMPNSLSALMFGGVSGADPFGMVKKNSSAIQDIARAMGQGKTITDAQWAKAGYGPGGK